MQTLSVLITGFGPFPGVDKNCSGDLAVAVCAALNARSASRSINPIQANAAVLSVEWHAISDHVARLYAEHSPNVAIHFGVCHTVTGLAIEQNAHNACAADVDACGRIPETQVLQDGASDVLQTHLPVTKLIESCKALPIDITASDDAGRYLCNAAYYASLSHAARQTPQSDALFIHVPAALNRDAANWPAFVDTAIAIINCAVEQSLIARR